MDVSGDNLDASTLRSTHCHLNSDLRFFERSTTAQQSMLDDYRIPLTKHYWCIRSEIRSTRSPSWSSHMLLRTFLVVSKLRLLIFYSSLAPSTPPSCFFFPCRQPILQVTPKKSSQTQCSSSATALGISQDHSSIKQISRRPIHSESGA